MAGSVVLRSYLDLVNGPLENTVNYSNDREPIVQQYSSLRKFTKRIGKLVDDGEDSEEEWDSSHPLEKVGDSNGFVFKFNVSSEGEHSPQHILTNIQNAMVARANGGNVPETSDNSLVYHNTEPWAQYVLDFGNDLKNPRYLAFFNLDSEPVYICKAAKKEANGYTLVPFLKVLPNQSIGPIIFNPRYGLLFVASDNKGEEQDLYVIAYNA